MLDNLIKLLMGMGFFLFGIKFLSQYFREIFDKKVRERIQSWTKTPILCFITGAILITVSQSVTALIVILFGMIRSNAISKERAIYVVIGANVGSCIIIFLVSLNVMIAVMIALGISGILYAVSSNKKVHNYAGCLFGIGCIFFGLNNIQTGAVPLSEVVSSGSIFALIKETYLLEFLMGALLSFMSQSSIMVVILAISLAKASFFGLNEMVMIIYGANVGTGLLMFVTTFKVRSEAKQLIVYQLISKLLSSTLLILLFYVELLTGLPLIVSWVRHISNNIGAQATLIYFIFNTVPLIFLLPAQKIILEKLGKIYPKSIEDIYSKPAFVLNTKDIAPYVLIDLIEAEQERIIQSFVLYFEELREKGDILNLSLLKNATKMLSEFIDQEVDDLVNRESLSQVEYLRVNNILIKQHIIDQCHETLLALSTALLKLRKNKEYEHFYRIVIEGIDIISLLLLDIVKSHDIKDFEILKKITTSKESGVSKLRSIYLKADNAASEKRSELLIVINQCEIIVFLFLDLARKYVIEKLNAPKTAS